MQTDSNGRRHGRNGERRARTIPPRTFDGVADKSNDFQDQTTSKPMAICLCTGRLIMFTACQTDVEGGMYSQADQGQWLSGVSRGLCVEVLLCKWDGT